MRRWRHARLLWSWRGESSEVRDVGEEEGEDGRPLAWHRHASVASAAAPFVPCWRSAVVFFFVASRTCAVDCVFGSQQYFADVTDQQIKNNDIAGKAGFRS